MLSYCSHENVVVNLLVRWASGTDLDGSVVRMGTSACMREHRGSMGRNMRGNKTINPFKTYLKEEGSKNGNKHPHSVTFTISTPL